MLFISDYCPTETKLIRDGAKPFMDLCIKTEGAYSKLNIINPETGEEIYLSPKGFYKKDAKGLYKNDPEFKKWFDTAVEMACEYRISRGLLRMRFDDEEVVPTLITPTPEDSVTADAFDDVIPTCIPGEVPQKKKGGRPRKDAYADPAPKGTPIEDIEINKSDSVLLG